MDIPKYLKIFLQKIEDLYKEQNFLGKIDPNIQFQYGWCLIRSKFSEDVKRGIVLLQDLCDKSDVSVKKDCLYYLVIGYAELKVQCLFC
jgi:fission 1 protein